MGLMHLIRRLPSMASSLAAARRLMSTVTNEKFISSLELTAEQAAEKIPLRVTFGFSGFTPSGYPKAIPTAFARRLQALIDAGKAGDAMMNIYTGASTGDELDGELVRTGRVALRMPYQSHKSNQINSGKVDFVDYHLSHAANAVRSGILPKVDVCVAEICDVTADGKIFLTHAVGNVPTFLEQASSVFLEINERVPTAMRGMHDIFEVPLAPHTQPIPITRVHQRIGKPYVQIDPKKIKGIVRTNMYDSTSEFRAPDDVSRKIAANILDFLQVEMDSGRLPKGADMPPIQSGVGNVANAVLAGIIEDKRYQSIKMYTEVLQDAVLDVYDAGKLKFASSTSLTLSPKCQDRLHDEIERFKEVIILRPQEISNHPEIIRRLGLVAMNTALEIDIYGNVNSTQVLGSAMMNGIGGSGDFTRNSRISIFMAPSVAKKGAISAIVPMVPHVDHNEHSVQVIVTEQGLADLRGLSPQKRSKAIIEKCASPLYRDALLDYVNEAHKNSFKLHTPVDLVNALSWHDRFLKSGSMLKAK
ncbi:hypothetical protein ACOME3_001380 [Neoechinorhynchus agilis]